MLNHENKPLVDGQHFYSKRNLVTYHKSRDSVYKKFIDKAAFECEVAVYQLLKVAATVHVPKVLEIDSNTLEIELQYVHGYLLLDCLMEAETLGDEQKAIELLDLLFDWIEGIHKVIGPAMILEDVNFRNFIFSNQILYGIDFEQVTDGDQTKEKAMILAMYLQYDPIASIFKEAVIRRYVQEKHIKWMDLMTVCQEEIQNRRKNRGIGRITRIV